jgi:hypothetical protein
LGSSPLLVATKEYDAKAAKEGETPQRPGKK